MQAVLYTNDFEPITVVRLSPSLWDMLERGREVRLPVPVTLPELLEPGSPMDTVPVRTVRIVAEKVRFRGKLGLMLFSPDEENALLLRSVFLPGQRSAVQEAERSAMARGFLEAFAAFRG